MMGELPGIVLQRLASITAQKITKVSSLGGGSINQCFRLEAGDERFFCKINSASKFPQLFLKEKKGLEALALPPLRTPEIIDQGEEGDWQFLVLEFIREGKRSSSFWEDFGHQLAVLHQHTSTKYGWEEDNYMGAVPQVNQLMTDWTDFFMIQRLQPMVKRCYDLHLLQPRHLRSFDKLYRSLSGIFDDEKPSLLHGDLWSGNFICNERSAPVLIDPAVYYGHRGMDLGMTRLFGGFDPLFYDAYHEHYPMGPQFKEQCEVCNLYPLLIHLFLFGGSYQDLIEDRLSPFDQ